MSRERPRMFEANCQGVVFAFCQMTPKATHHHVLGKTPDSLEFLKRARWELRSLQKVHVWKDKFHLIDVNGDYFEVTGVGYVDVDIVPLLQAVNAAFDPQTIHDPIAHDFKDYLTGRRHRWAEDRVM